MSELQGLLLFIVCQPRVIALNEQNYVMNEKLSDVTDIKAANDISNKLIDHNNFNFVINDQNVCNDCNDFLVVFAIHTALENIHKRTAIRETWGQTKPCLKVLYFVGLSNSTEITENIKNESHTYGDIVQGNFLDTYRNLSLKHITVLKWATNFCRKAKYIIKSDDDVMVNIDHLYEKLVNGYWGDKNLIGCKVWYKSFVCRKYCKFYGKHTSKYAVSRDEYPNSTYPDYCQGAFIIYSNDVLPRLLEGSNNVPYFSMEDVYVTGNIAKQVGIQLTNIRAWYLNKNLVSYIENKSKGPRFVKPFVYGPVQLEAQEIYKIWKIIKDYNNDVLRKIYADLVETVQQKNRARTILHNNYSQLKEAFGRRQ